MTKKINAKFLSMIMILAMVIGLLPALTLPARADATQPTIIPGSTAGGDAFVNIAEKAAGFNVVAQSIYATGTLYVVPAATASDMSSITGAAIGLVATAGVGVNATIGIIAGNGGVIDGFVYKVYAVDGVGTISSISDVAFTADLTRPSISSGTLAADNAYIDINVSEGIYGAADGATPLTAAKLALTFTQNGGAATNLAISSVKKNDNATEGSASALTGGETTVRVFLTVTGTPNGLETIEIKPADGASVYDKAGNAMLAAQTSGVKTLVNQTPAPPPPPPPSSDSGTDVLVNDKAYSAGSTASSTNDIGQSVTTVTVDTNRLNNILDTQGDGATVTIPVTSKTNVATGVLTGDMIGALQKNGATLVVKTDSVSYTIPASEINLGEISSLLGKNVTLANVSIAVSIAEPAKTTEVVVDNAVEDGGYALVIPPVDFTVTATSNGTTVLVDTFNIYVERTVAIPDGVDHRKITTAIVVGPDGTTHHVPTKVTIIAGRYYAVINSLTNSTYALVYNSIEFADVSNSWAKDAINDMGSRMVVTGVGNNAYAPGRDITRAEFATIIVRALGLEAGKGPNMFSDVSSADWYCDYIETALSYGLIYGYDVGTFGPNDKITREQAMTIIARAMKITGLSTALTDGEKSALLSKFTDSSKASSFASTALAACVSNGIVYGRTSTTINPMEYLARSEAAVIVQRLLQKSLLI